MTLTTAERINAEDYALTVSLTIRNLATTYRRDHGDAPSGMEYVAAIPCTAPRGINSIAGLRVVYTDTAVPQIRVEPRVETEPPRTAETAQERRAEERSERWAWL